ncbi:MAG TPA: PadR family transcriptional regulator [Clostridiaceae bacterium]|jgi:PadR family transcriptional regulator PadR|nr:PadR family transcriptional regulator [Clostridiaceae bacterium]HHT92713.1 PadR family transcriptional regulator [Clostridiaceae bacterium]HOA32281.1 PadR family transcriptional regulator [Clostridia bacterium]
MAFNVTTTLLDALVLSVVSKEDTYGYKITQEVKEAIDISDSTLYPVLRRLQKDDCLNIYDVEHSGRNRRYYKITNKGKLQLALYREEWEIFKKKIDYVLKGDDDDEQV